MDVKKGQDLYYFVRGPTPIDHVVRVILDEGTHNGTGQAYMLEVVSTSELLHMRARQPPDARPTHVAFSKITPDLLEIVLLCPIPIRDARLRVFYYPPICEL